MAKADYTQLSKEVIEAVGGKENIVNVTNCMTRLRFVLKDDSIPDKGKVSGIKGVKGVMNQGGQYQVIIGTHVSEVVKIVKREAGISDDGPNKEDYRIEKQGSLWNRFFKVISGCIMPMIGPMIAGGIIKGILIILVTAGVLTKTDGTYQVLYAATDAVLYFMPIVVGFTCGKIFDCNQYVTATIGAAFVYPDLVAAATAEGGITFLGLPVAATTYSNTLFPVILSAFVASKLEKLTKKFIPQMIQLMLVPAFVLAITVPLSWLAIGPVMNIVSNGLSTAVFAVFGFSPLLGGQEVFSMEGFKTLTGEDTPNMLYPFFWQHGESHSVLGEYMEKIASAGIKGICIEARPHPEFVQDGWWKDMDFLLKKAKELDMKLWILDDAHFPTGFANGRVKKDYPQYLKWYLDMRRYDVQGPMKGARIDFRLLKGRPWEQPDKGEKILGVYMAQRLNQRTEENDSLKSDSFIDITGNMDMKNRLLTLDIPEGAHSIFVVYRTRKGGEETTADYLNPLMKEATHVLIEEVYEPHYAHYKEEFGKTIQGFFSDEPRFGNMKGTEGRIGTGMVLPWREGLERELGFESKYLPLLWTAAEGKENGIRCRYMDVVTRLYNENFTKVIGDWCRGRGVWYLGHTIEDNGAHARLGYGTGHFFRGQQDMDFSGIDVIGGQIVPGMNYHHDAFNTGGSNGEFYHYALAKLGSSAAHLDSKKEGRVMCEAFGAYGWNEGLKMMKWIADHLIVRGINWIVPHAFNPKEFPDFDCPPHFYAHGHNPQFRYFKVFCDYVNRMAGLFRKGKHPAKVGVFYPAELEWAGKYMPIEKPARALTEHQISFDIVSLDYLKGAKISENGYVINGQEMEVLVIPYGECFPEELVSILEKMCDNNIKIWMVEGAPEKICSLDNDAGHSDRLERLISRCSVSGLGELGCVLKEYAAVVCAEPQADLAVGEYVREGKRYYMLFNENIGKGIHTKIRLSQQGYIYRYDGFQDRLVLAVQDVGMQESSMQEIRLDLEPYESTVLVVSEERLQWISDGRESVLAEEEFWTEEELWADVTLPSVWDIRFSDSMNYPEFKEKIPCHSLSCIQTLPGWENKTGTVRYEAHMNMEKAEQVKGAVLDLGEAYETAEVFVNQKSAGVRLCKPYTFDITELLQEGDNEIGIEITNTLGTEVRDVISHYLVMEPFGVQGPVSLKIKRGGIR